ncbi:MAG: DUF1844 domain-containing protein [Desulfobacterales bacterium]
MTEEKKGFVIKDKRIFSQTESDQEEAKETPEATPESTQKDDESAQTAPETEKETAETKTEERAETLPEINFATFVFSLNSSVLLHLGVIEDPTSGTKTKNLLLAKQTIDILVMLEEKTRGNLSSDEEAMLKNILYDLRILYVKEKG